MALASGGRPTRKRRRLPTVVSRPYPQSGRRRKRAKAPSPEFRTAYAASLSRALALDGPLPPGVGGAIGRRALFKDLGVLALVSLHHEVMDARLSALSDPHDEIRRLVTIGNRFLLRNLRPYDAALRDARTSLVELRLLNLKLQQKLDDEANRIGHALHDEAGQLLASVHLALEDVARDLQPRDRERIYDLRKLLDEIELQLRSLAHEVRPVILDERGLQAAVEFLAASASARTGVPVVVSGSIPERVPPTIETAMYRIIQEALTNAIRHAQPRRVLVSLARTRHALQCRVVDEGSGFTRAEPGEGRQENGIGLVDIRERVDALEGTLRIRSIPGQGTAVRVELPLVG